MGLDLSETLIGKSTELTADDLTGCKRFLKITKLQVTDDPKRPVQIFYVGDEGRPWRPCLTMRRVLAGCFGKDADNYIGQVVEVYRDDSVTYGEKGQGLQNVGGVRFRRASIKETITISVQAKRGSKSTWVVNPIPSNELAALEQPPPDPHQQRLAAIRKASINQLPGARARAAELLTRKEISDADHAEILATIDARAAELGGEGA